METKPIIFCVEDDPNILELIGYTLTQSGFDFSGFENAKAFDEAIKDSVPDLILLDIMLPDNDGYSMLSSLRSSQRTINTPIIMLTAKSSQLDKIKGLDAGADDYITKPFDILELISRIKAVLRRSSKSAPVVEYMGISIDTDKRSVDVNGKAVVLTYKEFELLYYLLVNKGIVLDRDKIMSNVWGTQFRGETRTVDVHIRSLRQKLGDAGNYIETVRNVGYRIS